MRLRAHVVAGQALRHCGHLVHHMVQFAVALVVVLVLLVGGLAWRLSEGPIQVTGLAQRLERALNLDSRTRISIGEAAIAWEGWHQGVDRALDIRLTGVAAVDPSGKRVASIPRAEVSLSASRLLLFQIIPRAIEIDGARLTVTRTANDGVSLDLGGLADAAGVGAVPTQAAGGGFSQIIEDLMQPPQGDRGTAVSRWAQLRRVLIRDAQIDVVDQALHTNWSAPRVKVDMQRSAGGGFQGQGVIDIALGGQTARLTFDAALAPATGGMLPSATTLNAELTTFNPADLAAAVPALGGLAAVKSPVTLSGSARLDAAFHLAGANVRAALGEGAIALGSGFLPIRSAQLSADIAANRHITARIEHVELAPQPHDPVTTNVTGRIDAQPAASGGGMDAAIVVDLDHVAFADLPVLWPPGVGGNGTRPWITKNVVAGLAHDLHVEAAVTIPPDFSDAQLRSVKGGLLGSDLTVFWLRPVPAIEHGEARLTFVDPDTINIAILTGRQGGITIQKGNVRVTGIEEKDQFADIDGRLASPLADMIALLKNPKVALLKRRPIPMQNPSGEIAGTLTVTALPLRDSVTLDDLRIHTTVHATDVHLGGIAAGRDLDHGDLDLDGGNNGMTIKGTAQFASIPVDLA
ncbi:MAG TPA: DUF3971 domain-containing protein, partial [Acetobacteraceae bacterium]|nr:DUF3971 domain-containing protein [Acetobacteraceae bacterium]